MTCKIVLFWDSEAMVWVATSDDVPGFTLEDRSADSLISRSLLAAPELLEANCNYTGEIDFTFEMSRNERLAAVG